MLTHDANLNNAKGLIAEPEKAFEKAEGKGQAPPEKGDDQLCQFFCEFGKTGSELALSICECKCSDFATESAKLL